MNLLFALLLLTVPLKEPQVYYYNSGRLVALRTITMPNEPRAVLEFFVHSPFELVSATLDSSSVHVCLPAISTRKTLNLEGRWYIIRWSTPLSSGSTGHELGLHSFWHKIFKKFFRIEVEGSKRVEKPQGVR